MTDINIFRAYMTKRTASLKKEDGEIDISEYLPTIEAVANERDGKKASYASTKNWAREDSTHFVGTCVEYAVSLATKIPFNSEYLVTGDAGFDFVHKGLSYDVKGVLQHKDPHLKEFVDVVNKDKADYYILGSLREGRFVKLVGWASREQLENAKHRDYGYGPRLSLTSSELRDMGQLGLPPMLFV